MSDDVSIVLDGKVFSAVSQVRLSAAVDDLRTLELTTPWDPSIAAHRSAFRPFSFLPITASIDGDVWFTGTVAKNPATVNPTGAVMALGAYSLPGALRQCTPTGAKPAPVEFRGQTVHEIAGILADPFGVQIDARVAAGAPFKKVAKGIDQKILPFLTSLTQQRNQLISDNENGDLVFQAGADDALPLAVANLSEDSAPLVEVIPQFNDGEYYSEITGVKPTRTRNKNSARFTARNTLLPDVYRPYTYEVDDSEDGDLQTAVTAKIGRMLASSVSYDVVVPTWRTPTGNLWEPNTFVTVHAPKARIYSPYTFLIRSVVLRKGPDRLSAELNLVLPGAFTGVIPGVLPWDE